MKVIVNKKNIEIPNSFKVIDLLRHLNYMKSVAVFIDGEQLLLSDYEKRHIKENNNIRIFRPLSGG